MPSFSHAARIVSLAAVLGAVGLPATAAADPPGQVRIAVTCGAESFEARSGLGGSAAWIAERDGRRLVLLPAAVSGTVSDAQGAVLRTFDRDLGGRESGERTPCTFAFDLDQDGATVSIAGQGLFFVRGA
jgi:hypothetical protein